MRALEYLQARLYLTLKTSGSVGLRRWVPDLLARGSLTTAPRRSNRSPPYPHRNTAASPFYRNPEARPRCSKRSCRRPRAS